MRASVAGMTANHNNTGMNVLHLTDTHLFADDGRTLHGVDTGASLRAIVGQIVARGPAPDAVIVSGDISHDESRGGYRRLRDILAAFEVPCVCLPGNHDDLELMREELGADLSVLSAIEVGQWRIVPVDSQVPGDVHGLIGPERQAQMEATLDAAPDAPTLLAWHHPPVECGSKWLDDSALRNGAALLRSAAQRPQVKALLCGHIHQPLDVDRGGLRVLATPATCRQFAVGSEGFALSDEAPGWRWLRLGAGTFTTDIERLDADAWQSALAASTSLA
jgi:Icc protein